MTLKFIGVNDAYYGLKDLIKTEGKYMKSRNGLVRALTKPIMIEITNPAQRILYDVERRANPFFHFVEAMWMLGGGRDVATVAKYNANMASFSDDGETFNAAYGYRWKHYFGYDQIQRAVDMLKANPDDRRVVITMWDAYEDLGSSSKDIPCNQQAMFRIVNGKLDMFTTNRSNDLIWGLCGANAVHLTILQEYMAAAVGVPMGVWTHVSNNLHIYDQHFYLMDSTNRGYVTGYLPDPVVVDASLFMEDCIQVCEGNSDFKTNFFNRTLYPLMSAWGSYKNNCLSAAQEEANKIELWDIKLACTRWLEGAKK